MDYYASYKNSKAPSLLRKELVSYALQYGNKKAAHHFQTTVKTVRKWRKRWEEKKGAGLKDLSKKPKKSPCMMKMYWQFKIKDIAEKASADNQQPRRKASGYVVLIRWLQSALIPFVTTQSVGVLNPPHE